MAPLSYMDAIKMTQNEAEKVGISLYVTLFDYIFDLSLPFRTQSFVKEARVEMTKEGLPVDAPLYYSGHSMGIGANLPEIDELYRDGVIAGCVMQAAWILHKYMPPMQDAWEWPTPTLMIGGDLNYGTSRPMRMAEALYHQKETTHPVVILEGVNHMIFANGFEAADLKPEVTEAEAQLQVAKLSVDWMAKELGLQGAGKWLQAEVKRTKAFAAPLIAAYEYEGSRLFNVPNQPGTPNYDCSGIVCPEGSEFINDAQAYIVKSEVGDKVQFKSNFAVQLRRLTATVQGRTIQAFETQAQNNFEKDTNLPHSPGEISAKFVSGQTAAEQILGVKKAAADSDVCKELNQRTYKYALEHAAPKASQRFRASGQELVFDDTVYKLSYSDWAYPKMSWKEEDGKQHVSSVGFIRNGEHHCKLLAPSQAMEWVYMEGLKSKLWSETGH